MVELNPLDESGYEKNLLSQYGESVGGRIVAEAPVSGGGDSRPWPEGSHRRWLDGVRIPSEYVTNEPELVRYESGMRSQLIEDVTGSEVEIIEAKESLNRPVVGQAIVGADMFRPRKITGIVPSVFGEDTNVSTQFT